MQISSTLRSDEILTQIRWIAAQIPGCLLPRDQILPEHSLREDLGLDSLAMVDLMVAIEDTLGVYFDPVQMDLDAAFETVGSIAGFVAALKGG